MYITHFSPKNSTNGSLLFSEFSSPINLVAVLQQKSQAAPLMFDSLSVTHLYALSLMLADPSTSKDYVLPRAPYWLDVVAGEVWQVSALYLFLLIYFMKFIQISIV
jgi:hypothetical protein